MTEPRTNYRTCSKGELCCNERQGHLQIGDYYTRHRAVCIECDKANQRAKYASSRPKPVKQRDPKKSVFNDDNCKTWQMSLANDIIKNGLTTTNRYDQGANR